MLILYTSSLSITAPLYNYKFIYHLSTVTSHLDDWLSFVNTNYNTHWNSYSLELSVFQSYIFVPTTLRASLLGPSFDSDIDFLEHLVLINLFLYASDLLIYKLKKLLEVIVVIMLLGSVSNSCPTLYDPFDCSIPGFPVLHYLLEIAQTCVHCVGDAVQPSRPLSPTSPPALNLPQHQVLFQWICFSHQVAKFLELQFQHQSFWWIFKVDFF